MNGLHNGYQQVDEMFKLSGTPSKEEYKANDGKPALLGTQEVTIHLERVDTKSGSWERGFKFGSITYGILKRTVLKKRKSVLMYSHSEYSCNHGVTWHSTVSDAKKSKGKVIVDKPRPHGEFAFDSIQRINKNYFGPSYKWTP
jgi:hypothetical protein